MVAVSETSTGRVEGLVSFHWKIAAGIELSSTLRGMKGLKASRDTRTGSASSPNSIHAKGYSPRKVADCIRRTPGKVSGRNPPPATNGGCNALSRIDATGASPSFLAHSAKKV